MTADAAALHALHTALSPFQTKDDPSMTGALQQLLAGTPPSSVRLPWGAPACAPCQQGTPSACLTPTVCLLTSLYCDLGNAGRRCTAALLSTGSRDAASIAAELRGIVGGVSAALVASMVAAGWGREALQQLPLGVALPLLEALQRCRADPPDGRRITWCLGRTGTRC